MPVRSLPFAVDQFYHIYNRGVARKPVFLNKRDYERFLLTLSYYRYKSPPFKLSRFLEFPQEIQQNTLQSLENTGETQVEIICYALLTNHFHLLIKQLKDNGISTYMRRSVNSYARYFNTKRVRPGALFQSIFKAVRVESDEQLIHLSRYIHLNPYVSYQVKEKDFLKYPWSSLNDFLNKKTSFINSKPVLDHFSSPEAYKKFVIDQLDYAKTLEEIKHLTFKE